MGQTACGSYLVCGGVPNGRDFDRGNAVGVLRGIRSPSSGCAGTGSVRQTWLDLAQPLTRQLQTRNELNDAEPVDTRSTVR